MAQDDRKFLTRSETVSREQRNIKRKKLDRLLNVLIAIVVILIVINLIIIFSKDDGGNDTSSEKGSDTTLNQEQPQTPNDDAQIPTVDDDSSEQQSGNEEDNEDTTKKDQIIKQNSEDPIVEEVIMNDNWQPTPTKQTGQHISTYEEGHIDYEEKLETFRNAVNLSADNSIFWSVKNNGSSETSIAVVSSTDKTQNYRISIEWIENEGWKPVKVEKLKQIEGSY